MSWNDVQAYIRWLNEKTGENYRLPTEVEWEFSCRAGATTKWYFGDDKTKLGEYAWYKEIGEEYDSYGTSPVTKSMGLV